MVETEAVVVAVDHGLHWGAYEGFERPETTLRTVLEAGVDGVLAGVPFLRRFDSLLAEYGVTRIATLDQLHDSTIPGRSEGAEIHQQVFTAEAAAAAGADAAKLALVYGRADADVLADNLQFTATAAAECRAADLPLVVEPTLWGQRLDDEFDPAHLADAARIAFELGADVLKSPYPGRDGFGSIVRNAPVPVYVAGGPAVDADREVLEMVAGARDAGGRGVMFGRNVWQRENPAAVARALRALVHDGATVDDAEELLDR